MSKVDWAIAILILISAAIGWAALVNQFKVTFDNSVEIDRLKMNNDYLTGEQNTYQSYVYERNCTGAFAGQEVACLREKDLNTRKNGN